MTTNRYNGWRNYETWNVALWLDNDRSAYETCLELTQQAVGNAEHTSPQWWLGQRIRELVEDSMLPQLEASMASDLLTHAVGNVDWDEVADHYLTDIV